MAVSKNGSMGLGGDAEGFEIANQGVTRRRPGEGPKANGGRSQLQTMDSYDQPQYEGNVVDFKSFGDRARAHAKKLGLSDKEIRKIRRIIDDVGPMIAKQKNQTPEEYMESVFEFLNSTDMTKEAMDVPTGDDAYDGGGWDYDDMSDPFGMNQACNRCGSLGNWDNATCPNCEPEPDVATVGHEQNEQHCPSCDGEGPDKGCDACADYGTFEAYLNVQAGGVGENIPSPDSPGPPSGIAMFDDINEEMPNFNAGNPEGWDRQIAQGATNTGRDVSDEEIPRLEGAGSIDQAIQNYMKYGETGEPPVLQPKYPKFDPTRTTGTSGYDFTQDNPELIQQLGISPENELDINVREMFESGPDEVGGETIVWSPGEYGSDTKKVLKYLDKESWGGNSIWLKLNQSGPHAMIDLEQEEAMALSNALMQFLKTMRYDTKNVNLAEDVIEQIEEKFGELPAPQGFYEGKEETLKKSSEKEQGEHPWASKKVASQIAKDHMKLGEVFRFRKVKP